MKVGVVSTICVLTVGTAADVGVGYDGVKPTIHDVFTAGITGVIL